MASAERIDLMRCPACREHVLAPPPGVDVVWECPFCRRRFRRRIQSSKSSGTIACFSLHGTGPRAAARRVPEWWLQIGDGVASATLTVYAAALLGLMFAYHVAMSVLAAVWLAVRFPAIVGRAVAPDDHGDDSAASPPWLEPVRTWLPHFRRYSDDTGLGPALESGDSPALFVVISEVARRVGVPPPDEIRLTHLPCCGVIEQRRWFGLRSRRRVLVVGLPLLYVLRVEELRAVVAHELAHLSRGDAAMAFIVSQFVESLDQSIGSGSRMPLGWLNPCVWLARVVRAGFRLVSSPLSRYQEYRADRVAAALSGSDVLAAALRVSALVQPVFKEALCHYHPTVVQDANLYQFFRAAWSAMGDALKHEMQDALVADQWPGWFDPHPTLRARLRRLDRFPAHPQPDDRPARRLLPNRRKLEEMLHDFIYGARGSRLTIFRAPAD
jgi:Zn-dependent protease with chaperone function